jgi:2-methylcitrate dehydratase PrpD
MAAQYEAMSKRMQHGFAARNGFYAAGLAAAGYTGIKRVFEREYGGFLATFGEGHDPEPEEIAAELGSRWETTQIVIKSYAAMGGLHAAIDAVRAIDAGAPVDTDDIERIDIALGHAVYHHGWWQPQRPLTPTGAQMNVGYVVAAALLDGNVLPEQFTAERLDADDVWRLVERVHVRHDEEIDRAGPAGRATTDLTITLRDGSTRHRRITQPRGGPANPLRNDEIVDKYRALTSRVLDQGRQREIEDAVLRLDELSDASDLMHLLAGPVARALD